MAERPRLKPGDTVGILGGGQLGRMLALAAARLGLNCHIYCPDPKSPAFDVTRRFTIAGYDDEMALAAFADACNVITYEFENVPAETAAFLAARRPVLPDARALEVAQDRLNEKSFIAGLGIAVPAFAAVGSLHELRNALPRIGLPCVLKTRRFGYDGKGQFVLRDAADAGAAWQAIGENPAILEAFVSFSREISVILARGRDGQMHAYDPPENLHRDQILRRSSVPANIPVAIVDNAIATAKQIAAGLDYVGVLGVELFVLDGAESPLMVNEIAPRVHNSGHWTMDACLVSQFEQHIRAIAGMPLGNPARHSDVVMENLIGGEAESWETLLAEPGVALHLYGKAEIRSGRKMGHINRLSPLSHKS